MGAETTVPECAVFFSDNMTGCRLPADHDGAHDIGVNALSARSAQFEALAKKAKGLLHIHGRPHVCESCGTLDEASDILSSLAELAKGE